MSLIGNFMWQFQVRNEITSRTILKDLFTKQKSLQESVRRHVDDGKSHSMPFCQSGGQFASTATVKNQRFGGCWPYLPKSIT